jgi:aminoglycoside phosphotransferase family enzyme/predicted kinase
MEHHPLGRPAVEETHISTVFLTGDRAYKLKKDVRLPFLDWTARGAREAACHDEVRLNRRIAPDVYLGVADVVQDGAPCDHLVVMRRMPADRRLSRLVSAGVDVGEGIDAIAAAMADFHAGAARSADVERWTSTTAVRRNWADNIAVLADEGGAILDPAQVRRVAALAERYLDGRDALFSERSARGFHVDGHGDLLADDVYLLEDGPRILDCLEFAPQLRAVDVLDDVAFLAMDLERLGAPDEAARLVAAYDRHSGEAHPATLLHHFVAYRAGVRAKVACIRRTEGDERAGADAVDLLALALRHLEAGQVRLILVGGLPGTGKSTLSAAMCGRAGWRLLRSDVIRKELAGLDPSTPAPAEFGEGLYDATHSARTYHLLLERAARLLRLGETVVLDATWLDPHRRAEAVAVATETASELVELRCVAPAELAAERLLSRPASDPSDATPDVAAVMAQRARPWPEAREIDTTTTVVASVDRALEGCR